MLNVQCKKMAKLWDKGFEIQDKIERFTIGRDREMDLYLAEADVLGSMAHITMLESIGLLQTDELKQLLAELSPAARESLSLGDNASSLISAGLAAGQPAGAQIIQNNSNVSAPVTIQVRSSGANAEQIGQKLYDTTERYLLRTLRSVMV